MEDVRTEESRRLGRVFLSAEWRDLVMLNYQVDPELLLEYVPSGTELDFFKGQTFISLVGFRFLRTKVLGAFGFPFHANFDEVNLRFYVTRREGDDCRRGVAFIREIVPRWLIAQVARFAYGENYFCYPMRHRADSKETGKMAEYEWGADRKWCRLYAQASGIPARPREGTLEEFITEHYWGYSRRTLGRSLEYRVSHTPWRVWVSTEAGFEGDGTSIYGQKLGGVLNRRPDSALIAEGSPVMIYTGRAIS